VASSPARRAVGIERGIHPFAAGALVFLPAASGAILAMVLHPLRPPEHLAQPTIELVRTAIGIVGVTTSMVLGLLIFSAKGGFDAIDREMRQFAADVVLLDQLLRPFGETAAEPRSLLRQYMIETIARLWPEHAGFAPPQESVASGRALERIADLVGQLPVADEHRRTRAQGVCDDLIRRRWVMIEQTFNVIQTPFLALLAAWTTVIFASFGYVAPTNWLAGVVLVVSAASVAGAVVLITDLVRPFSGLVRVPSVPMRRALDFLTE
jgi:hypothetical protein